MPKIPDCDRCVYCAHNYHLVCAIHPDGLAGDRCVDFSPGSELKRRHFVNFLRILEDSEPDEAQWEPVGARYVDSDLVIERDRTFYNGEEIVQPQQRRTREQQMWLLDNHPMFTGRCPQCGAAYECDYRAIVHWDCSRCGWMDDSV